MNNIVGALLGLIAFSIVFNRKHLASVYNNRGKIAKKVRDSSDQERVVFGAMVFVLALGFLLASL